MSKKTRREAAELAVVAAQSLDTHVNAAVLFSLCIMFENWLVLGGDETQKRMKLLDEGEVIKFELRPAT